MMELSDRRNVDNSTLLGFLKPIDPSCSYVDANFRIWAKREMNICQDSGKRTFITENDLKVMFNDVVNKTDLTVTVEKAKKLYRLLLKETLGNCQNKWEVETYLQKLHDSDEQFDYKIARDTDFGSEIMVVWQTGTMRADFELLCSTLGFHEERAKFIHVTLHLCCCNRCQ